MEDDLITLLESFKYDVYRQGSLAEDAAYPDTFITFWNRTENGHSYYDNDCVLENTSFDVNVYSVSPDTTYSLLRQVKDLLKSNGWVITEFGHDLASDEETHTGRGMEVAFLFH